MLKQIRTAHRFPTTGSAVVGHHWKNNGCKQLGSINVLSVTDIDELGIYPQPKKSLYDSWYVVVTLRFLSIHSLMWIMLPASSACRVATLLPHYFSRVVRVRSRSRASSLLSW